MKKKPVALQNYRSRSIIHADSITEFCRKARLKSIDKYHFTPVLKGERLHHKGWHLPFEAEYIICDIYGNQYYLDNLVDFAKRYQLNVNKLQQLINLEIPNYNGLYLLGQEPPIHIPNTIHIFSFTNGSEKIKNARVAEIAEQIGVNRRSVYYVITGQRSSVKGWELDKVEWKLKKKKIL